MDKALGRIFDRYPPESYDDGNRYFGPTLAYQKKHGFWRKGPFNSDVEEYKILQRDYPEEKWGGFGSSLKDARAELVDFFETCQREKYVKEILSLSAMKKELKKSPVFQFQIRYDKKDHSQMQWASDSNIERFEIILDSVPFGWWA